MPQHDLAQLESRTKELMTKLTAFSDTNDFEGMLKLLHKPGWTTPAEYLLVSGIVESLHEHVQAVLTLKQVLIEGSRRVGVES